MNRYHIDTFVIGQTLLGIERDSHILKFRLSNDFNLTVVAKDSYFPDECVREHGDVLWERINGMSVYGPGYDPMPSSPKEDHFFSHHLMLSTENSSFFSASSITKEQGGGTLDVSVGYWNQPVKSKHYVLVNGEEIPVPEIDEPKKSGFRTYF